MPTYVSLQQQQRLYRPITVVSGPEIMDKFVGSSEMKLREIFDKPPDIYEYFRSQEADNGDAIAKAVRIYAHDSEFDRVLIGPSALLNDRASHEYSTRLILLFSCRRFTSLVRTQECSSFADDRRRIELTFVFSSSSFHFSHG